jgi:hypothetical protein
MVRTHFIVAGAAVLAGATLFAAQTGTAWAEVESKHFDTAGIRRLELTNSSGAVRITAAATDRADVTADKRRFSPSCKLTIERSGDTLVVEAKDSAWLGGDLCEVDFDVAVPASASVKIKVGSGALRIDGLRGDAEIATGSSNVELKGEPQRLQCKTGSGNVKVSGLSGGAELKSGSGDIEVNYRRPPASGKLTIATGSGDSTVSFPSGSRVATSFRAGSGRLTNDLGDTAGAPFQLSAAAGSGNLHVKKTP